MRPPAVTADALHRYPEGVGSGLERPYAEPEGAFVEQGFGVGTVDFLYVVLCEHPGVNHGLRAFGDFFCGLKDPDDAAREVVVRPEVTKGPHQPRLVPVVTAGVRLPLMRALPRVRRGVGHWERIDVSTQRYGFTGLRAVNDGDDAALHHIGVNRNAPVREVLHDARHGFRCVKL